MGYPIFRQSHMAFSSLTRTRWDCYRRERRNLALIQPKFWGIQFLLYQATRDGLLLDNCTALDFRIHAILSIQVLMCHMASGQSDGYKNQPLNFQDAAVFPSEHPMNFPSSWSQEKLNPFASDILDALSKVPTWQWLAAWRMPLPAAWCSPRRWRIAVPMQRRNAARSPRRCCRPIGQWDAENFHTTSGSTSQKTGKLS